jgi:hypothetical protein
MAKKKPNLKLCERRLLTAQQHNEIDPEKANQIKDEAILQLLNELGFKGLAMAYDNVKKLYENQTRTR